MKTTDKPRRKRKTTQPHTAKHPRPEHPEHELQEATEEGAGNNDERELPEELRNAPATPAEKRPPTNSVPDRPQDPSTPAYKEPPNPHDRIVNN